MPWTPKFNTKSCSKWFNQLYGAELLAVSKNICHLIPPFEIVINQDIYDEIKNIYVPYEEKGGLMLAQFKKQKTTYTLEIRSIHEIENYVEVYFPGESRKNSYYPKNEKYLQIISDNFSKDNSLEILIPINFHTHPTETREDDLKYFNNVTHQLDMSDADLNCAFKWQILFNNFHLLSLNAIITGNEKEHRIIFYGYKVTPKDFIDIKSEQLMESNKDFLNGIPNEGWRFAIGLCKFGLELFTAIKAPSEYYRIMENRVHSLDKNEFWGKLKNGTTVIKIPKRSDNELNWDDNS